ncbi:MAG: SigE family RNA polymerase sigma factor [Nocardioides sp.]|uniref:SigE family RNA polymerase sigma factor n=1 Tax=Nocardioides sp. TaxID=35761 RepID=UPI0039E336AE
MTALTEPMSYAQLAAARRPALLRLAVMLSGDAEQAEDLVQSTLLRTQRHASRIIAMESPAAYLRRALVNEYLSWRRSLRRRPPPLALSAALPTDQDPVVRIGQRDLVWRLLAELPRRQRAVLALRYYEDLPDAEIAKVLGCSEGTVRSHASRAFATLRARLSDPEVNP